MRTVKRLGFRHIIDLNNFLQQKQTDVVADTVKELMDILKEIGILTNIFGKFFFQDNKPIFVLLI